MSNYAAKTTVSSEKSRNEIERTLRRFGADQFAYGWEETRAVIQFRAHERLIRFVLELPDKDDPRFTRTLSGLLRHESGPILKAWEQATRSVWRSLALVIKAKLIAVEDGIVTFEQEFLAHVVLPTGGTVGEWAIPQIEAAYETSEALPALPGGFDQ